MIILAGYKECNALDLRSVSGLGRSPGEENGNPLQYSCLGNPVDRGVWRATVYGGGKELDLTMTNTFTSLHVDSEGKESACNAGDPGSILGSGRPTPVFLPGEFHGLEFQSGGL